MSSNAAVDYITAKQAADILNVPYRRVLDIVSVGGVKAYKEKGRWNIQKLEFNKFQRSNARKLKKIQDEYISLWRQGITWRQLKGRTRDDFEKRGIVYGDMDAFAEHTVYNYIMGEKKNKHL